MYKSKAIQKLEESLGYEKWILDKTIRFYRSSLGYEYPRKIVINDDYSKEIQINIKERVILDSSQELIYDLSPLLFVSGFKLLDMLMQYIITENNIECPWEFSKKKKILKDLNFNPKLPYPLAKDPTIFECFKKLYISFIKFRNGLIHGAWGKNESGNLTFDFQNNNKRINGYISFEQVIKFADCISICVEEILKTSDYRNDNSISTIYWCLNGLRSIHNFNEYPNYSVLNFDVVQKINYNDSNFPVVNIKYIKYTLDNNASNRTYDYTLRIEAEKNSEVSIWVIHSNIIGNSDKLVLNKEWDRYKL